MSFKKKVTLTIMMMVSILCLIFGAVACSGESAKDAIEKYILPQNETLVDADFTLPKTIGKSVEVTWTSSNTEVIAIEDSGDKYTAKVTLPAEVTTVTLTISSGGHSKDFTVRVDEFSVYTFIKNYKFAQKNTAVKEDFDLETETTLQGKTATISWAIDEKYNDWIVLNEAKNGVLVTPGEEVKSVEIAATFAYGGAEATQKYPFSVTPILEHRQIVKNMYSQEDYALELSGYIVHVYQALIHEKYGPEASFYMIDDDFCSGYYLYNVEIEEDQVDKYVAGAHVTVTGATATSYNGLWENKGNSGLAVIDDETPIDPREKVYAIDTDLLAGAPSLLWHESTFVSLSGWKVDSLGSAKPQEGTTGTLFTLKKGDATVAVTYSKYINFAEGEAAKVIGLYDTIKVGDFVNVMGILGNYKGFQIQPVLASDVTKVDAEVANTDGAKVAAAINAVNEAVAANFASLVAAHKEVTMPTSVEGVTISYKVAGATNLTVKIDGGKFTIDPVDSEKNYDIEVTYTIGDYKAYDFFKLHNWKQSSEEIVDNVKAALEAAKLAEVKHTGEFDLPVVDDLGTTITWTVKAPAPTWISIADGKIKVTALPAEDTEVTLVATIALDGQTATAELTLKVAAASAVAFKAIDTPVAGDYIFALYQGTLDKWLYANGEISTNSSGDFGATTDNPAEAATFTLAASGEGWTIQLKSSGKFLELNDNHRWCYVDTATQPWMWNTEAKVLTFTVSGTVYYLGTYGTYDTISASTIDRITGDNLNASGQYVAHFGTMAAAELTFKAIDAPAAGTYKFAMYNGNTKVTYYATGAMDGFYFATSEDVSEAADFVITQIGNENKYTVTVGGKYLEFVPRTDGKEGVNIALNDAQTAGKYWQWNEAIKNFVFESTYNKGGSADATDTDLYYLGTYGTFTTMSGNYISRIATKGDDGSYTANGKEGVDQWVAHFGTMVPGSGTTEPEPGPGGDEEHDDAKYGSETAPLSVTQALALAAEECTELSSWTRQLVYMTGKIKTIGDRRTGQSGDYYSNVYFVDPAAPSSEILAYSVSVNDVVTVLAQNDTVVICGYITLFGYSEPGTIEFSTKDSTIYVQALKNTRGESAITVEADGATVSGLPTGNKATNGTEITFQVAPAEGKQLVSVKVNEEALEATAEGSYTFTLNGDATIVVETVNEGAALPEEVAKLGFAAGEHDNDGQTNQYTETWEATRDNVTWTITSFSNNKGAWNLIKTGNKNKEVTGTITTKTALADAISRVVVTVDSSSKSYMADKVKSFKLLIADNAEFTGATEVTATIKVGENVFDIPAPAANMFYRIVIDCETASDNGFVVLTEVSYWINTQSAEPAGPAADEGFHFTMSTADIIGTWVSEDGHKVVITETTFLFTDPTGAKCTYTLTETQRGSFYNYSILWNGETYTIDSTGPTTLAFLKADGSPAYTFTKESGSQGGISFPEQLQGTFACTMAMIDEEPVEDLSSIPALVVTANGITWGTHSVTILGGDMGNYGLQIDGAEYTLMYTGSGWMLASENAMYTFGNGGAGPELSL